MQITIVMDSGAFLEELLAGRSYKSLDVGYFSSAPNVSDIKVLADGREVRLADNNLCKETIEHQERIEVRQIDSSGNDTGEIEVTQDLACALLRKVDLYPYDTPDFNVGSFDCILTFKAGRFCPSMIKERRFVEADTSTCNKTGKAVVPTKQIAHNVAIHYDLADGQGLEFKRDDGAILFSTAKLPQGVKRVDIDIVADNTTATRLFRDALDLSKCPTCWLPNQGDPPTLGCP